jgi:hypothetical protein
MVWEPFTARVNTAGLPYDMIGSHRASSCGYSNCLPQCHLHERTRKRGCLLCLRLCLPWLRSRYSEKLVITPRPARAGPTHTQNVFVQAPCVYPERGWGVGVEPENLVELAPENENPPITRLSQGSMTFFHRSSSATIELRGSPENTAKGSGSCPTCTDSRGVHMCCANEPQEGEPA